jgi:TolB-like protein
MLAVLPFENLTGDAGQEYFSDGMTEEMIAQLGNLDPEHLGVIARTSVMHYKNSKARWTRSAASWVCSMFLRAAFAATRTRSESPLSSSS